MTKLLTKKGKATQASLGVAEALLRLRETHHLTQRDIADRIGVSFQQYQKYEKGKDRLSLERAMRLSESLNVPLTFFAKGEASAGFAEGEQAAFNAEPKVTADEKELLSIFRDVPKKSRADFMAALKQMAKMLSAKR